MMWRRRSRFRPRFKRSFKKRFFKRRTFRRKGRKRLGNTTKAAIFKYTRVNQDGITMGPTHPSANFYTQVFRGNDITEMQNEISRWDEFRILKVRFTVKGYNGAFAGDAAIDFAAQPTTSPALMGEPIMAAIIDRDDDNLATSMSYLFQRGAKPRTLKQGFSKTFRPNVLAEIHKDQGTTYTGHSSKKAPWIDAADVVVPHYGVKWGVWGPVSTVGYDTKISFLETVEYWIQCRGKLPTTQSGNF